MWQVLGDWSVLPLLASASPLPCSQPSSVPVCGCLYEHEMSMYVGIVDMCTHVNSCICMSICIYACVMCKYLARCGDAQMTPWWF